MQGRQTALCVLKTPQIQQYHIRKQVLRPSSGGTSQIGVTCLYFRCRQTDTKLSNYSPIDDQTRFFFIMKNSLANQVLPKITRLHDALSAIVYRRRCFLCVDIFFVQKKIARPRRALCVWSFVCDIHSIQERNPKVRALGMAYIK
jgi:hypothetical protein